MTKPLDCPECTGSLRMIVQVVVDCPSSTKDLLIPAIANKGNQVVMVFWDLAIYYCKQCGYTTAKGDESESTEP